MINQSLLNKEVGPGRKLLTKGISTSVVSDHNEVFHYWQTSGIKNSVLFHVDGHSDLGSGAPILDYPAQYYYVDLSIGNFICPAVYTGIVNSIYWLNPHSNRLMYYPTSNIKVNEQDTYYKNLFLRWDIARDITNFGTEKESVNLPEGYILDIDLDAFCCCKRVEGVLTKENHSENWEGRLEGFLSFLTNVKRRPGLISIARSEGKLDQYYRFVPADKVDIVEEKLLDGLNKIF